MKWEGERESEEVEDRRGMSLGRGGVAIGGGGLLLVLLFSVLTGTDPTQVLQVVQGVSNVDTGPQPAGPMGAPSDQEGKFASVVLASTEDVWGEIFAQRGQRYEKPKLVLFSGAVRSACGTAQSAVGPFYCPRDSQVYLDLGFFQELSDRFGAPGDFARAYVVAHEVGHHVQNLLGISDRVESAQGRGSREEANELSVKLELQADCLAGVWGQRANQQHRWLEPGDIETGLAAAQAIGDDTLQRQAGAAVQPESWTHGSSAQRVHWLRTGLESGDLSKCDTFGDGSL
ncbi:MAG TPA: neutral zinc metallopeptidase [Myxococcota bacterium]|nr:neutral zinc metallopeptidase [Myxococcota bacterium]